MLQREVTISNRLGLHARAAAKLVGVANGYGAEVTLEKQGQRVNGKSIMGVMMLAAECGSTLSFRAQGPDETEAVEALVTLVDTGFGE